MHEASAQTTDQKKTTTERIVLTASKDDAEAMALFTEIRTAAKKARREPGEYLLIQLLEERAHGISFESTRD